MTALTPQQMRWIASDREETAETWPEYRIIAAKLREDAAALRTAADQIEAVREALSRHPKCDKYDEDDVVSCGWKSAVRDITWAVNHD